MEMAHGSFFGIPWEFVPTGDFFYDWGCERKPATQFIAVLRQVKSPAGPESFVLLGGKP